MASGVPHSHYLRWGKLVAPIQITLSPGLHWLIEGGARREGSMGRISHEVVSTVAKNQLPFVPGKKSDHSFIGGRLRSNRPLSAQAVSVTLPELWASAVSRNNHRSSPLCSFVYQSLKLLRNPWETKGYPVGATTPSRPCPTRSPGAVQWKKTDRDPLQRVPWPVKGFR